MRKILIYYNMASNIDKESLSRRILELEGLSDEERSALLELLNTRKKYGLVWEDKPEDIEGLLRDQLPVLTEVKERALTDGGDDAPNHVLIEGDNLAALTALSYTHEGKIDVIYIDPPYNTGNKDFVYNDSYVDSEDSYRHSKWLSFMDKRLRIAKRLLSDKGVIFISIDDNEDAQLKLLCDELFGNSNKIADVIWQSRKSVSNDTFVSMNHNYTIVFAKNLACWDKLSFRLPANTDNFENRDNDPRGPWVADPFDAPNIRPNLTYAIVNPNTGEEFWPPKGRCWRTTQEQYEQMLADNRIVFGKNGKTKPQLKRFMDFAISKGETATTMWTDIETTTDGTKKLMEIFGGEKVFTNPKPVSLIIRCLQLASNYCSTILDFFAGSGTTLHATMQLNAEDGGNRQCILVTNNENNICEEVTYERNKRVINGYTTPKGVAVDGLKHNNLRYYRTDFLPRDRSQRNRRALVNACTDLLCIKEDLYAEEQSFAGLRFKPTVARYFHQGNKRMLVVYDEMAIETVAEHVAECGATAEHPLKIYTFSPGQYAYTDEFEEVLPLVELCALPDAIYQAYRNVLPRRRPSTTPLENTPTEEELQQALNDEYEYHEVSE